MHDSNVKLCSVRRCVKTIITFGYCDIRNNEGLVKFYLQRPNAKANGTYPLLRPLLFQQLCAPWCELSVCGRCLRWHTNIYKLVGFLFFLIWGPLPFHPYLSGEPRLSSTAPLANFQWQNYNSCPSIELCRSGVWYNYILVIGLPVAEPVFLELF